MGDVRNSWTAALLVLFATAKPALPCVVIYPTVAASPTFRVKAADRGRPIQRLQVILYVGTTAKIYTTTDKEGIAMFRDVPPGVYHLFADHDAGFPGGADIDVKLAGPPNITVPLRWPSVAPAVASSLKGVLHMPGWMPEQGQPRIYLDLLEGISGRKLKSTYTDGSGAFDFPGVGRGLYFLKLTAGLIAVDIEPSATTPLLDLDLGETSCGLSYTNHSECPQTNLNLTRIGGHIFDESGGGIANAEALLLDVNGRLVQQARTDIAGNLASFRAADGRYQLIVRETGFTPLRATLTVEANGTSSPLEVQLGILGRCSRIQ